MSAFCLSIMMLSSPMAEYYPYTVYECIRQNAPLDLGIALMHAESNFDPYARGPINVDGTYDFGPYQLNSGYYYPYMTIYENISCGIAHLMVEYRKHKSNVLAVWAYNAGPSKVGKKLPKQTYGLLSRVFGKKLADKVKARLRGKL